MPLKTEIANDVPTAQTRYIRSKDDSVQIAVEMTDDLSKLCWGRLWVSTEPHDCPLVHVADPMAWAREQREQQQVKTSVRLAALRTDWLKEAAGIVYAGVERRAV